MIYFSFFLAGGPDFNASLVVGAFTGQYITLNCSSINNRSIFWLKSQDKNQLEAISSSDKYQLYNNNSILNVTSLNTTDESFYVCGFIDVLNNFITQASYFVFVKRNKIFSIFFIDFPITLFFKLFVFTYRDPNIANLFE